MRRLISKFEFCKSTVDLIAVLVGYKLVFASLVLVASEVFPYSFRGEFELHRHWPPGREWRPSSALATWDGAHYLYLAEHGYQHGDPACAFYPLFPLLIRGTAYLTAGSVLIAGLILTNVLSLAGLVLFHRFVNAYHGLEVANLATILLLSFPGAIFFSFIYTEALFLFLVVLFLTFLLRNNVVGTTITGFLLPLTKGIGIFCIVPLLWHVYSQKRPPREALAAYGPLIGYLSYFVVMYLFTGSPLEGFDAQQHYPNKASIANMVNAPEILSRLVRVDGFHAPLYSALDRFFFLLFLVCLVPIYRLNKTYFVYALFAGAVPAFSNWFYSYSRHVMMCIPMFIVLAEFLKGGDMRFLRWGFVAVLCAVQGFFLVRHISFMWAG